ncbi:MAG: methyl-accepting chemotaxis protein [Bacillota bacterium]|nr:methyl-accepting chemotaxis protein [Bacillota bacterium]
MKLSLRTKLMLAFTILIFLPISILVCFSYKMSADALQSSIQQQLMNDASQTSEQIQKTIDSAKYWLQVASLNDSVGKTAESSSSIDTSFQYIKDLRQNNNDFMEEIIITDAKGKVIIDSDTKEPNIDLSDRDYFKKAIGGTEAVSEILVSRFTGNNSVFIAYPLKNGDKIVGTLVGSIKFNAISKESEKIKVGKSGYAYMIDKGGLIVYHPNINKILKENLSSAADKNLRSLVDKIKSGKNSQGFYTYNKMYKYAVFKPAGNWIIAVTANYNEYMASAIEIRNNTIIIIIISLIIAVICAYIFSSKSIINPINNLKKVMKIAGDGDLSVSISIKSNDEMEELADAFNSMIKNQNEIIKNVEIAAQQLNAASQQMAASSEEMNAVTEEISASIKEVSQETESNNNSVVNASEVLVQLSSLVQLAQNKAKDASCNSDNAKNAAEFGRIKVDETIKAINVIRDGTFEAAKVLDIQKSLSNQVGGIISTINSIADQTNLLALNAAIEAARAGENGKGFSVVADEVRKLSEETNNKAKEIDLLVNEMVKQTKNAVDSMDRVKIEVGNGVDTVGETDKAFINIIKSVGDIVENINEILDITNDEVASSDQIVKLINEMATMTENTYSHSKTVSKAASEEAVSIEGLTAAVEETTVMAEELNNLVEKFTI